MARGALGEGSVRVVAGRGLWRAVGRRFGAGRGEVEEQALTWDVERVLARPPAPALVGVRGVGRRCGEGDHVVLVVAFGVDLGLVSHERPLDVARAARWL